MNDKWNFEELQKSVETSGCSTYCYVTKNDDGICNSKIYSSDTSLSGLEGCEYVPCSAENFAQYFPDIAYDNYNRFAVLSELLQTTESFSGTASGFCWRE